MSYQNEKPLTPEELREAKAEGHEFTSICDTCGRDIGPADGCRCSEDEDDYEPEEGQCSCGEWLTPHGNCPLCEPSYLV
jgi:hypothetical protein